MKLISCKDFAATLGHHALEMYLKAAFAALHKHRLQLRHQRFGNRNGAFLVSLRRPSVFRIVLDADRAIAEVRAFVRGVDDFLFAHPRHLEELEPQPFGLTASAEEFVQRLLFIDFRFFFDVLRPVMRLDLRLYVVMLQE